MKEARMQKPPTKKCHTRKMDELIDGKWNDKDWLVINTMKILITSEVCSHLSPK